MQQKDAFTQFAKATKPPEYYSYFNGLERRVNSLHSLITFMSFANKEGHLDSVEIDVVEHFGNKNSRVTVSIKPEKSPITHQKYFSYNYNLDSYQFIYSQILEAINSEGIRIKLKEVQNENDLINSYLNEMKLKFKTVEYIHTNNSIYTSRREPPSKTYIMKDEVLGYYKIGASSNPRRRERTLQAEKPVIVLVATLNKNIESQLHEQYKKHRIRGEWFDLNELQVNEMIQKHRFKRS